MRTKITILSAVAMAAGMLTSDAQVYSANVVGYVNINIAANQKFTLLANPLSNGGNQISNVLSTLPDGNSVLTFSGGSFGQNVKDLFGGGFDNPSQVLAPGTGFFIKNDNDTAMTITFVGEVEQGLRTNALPFNAYALVGSHTPVGTNIADLGYAGVDGDYVYKYSNGFVQYIRDLFGGGWSPVGPECDAVKGPKLSVAEGLFYNNQSGAAAQWISNFTVQ
jgi:hypothetical protein